MSNKKNYYVIIYISIKSTFLKIKSHSNNFSPESIFIMEKVIPFLLKNKKVTFLAKIYILVDP